jgi:hypothetical protein
MAEVRLERPGVDPRRSPQARCYSCSQQIEAAPLGGLFVGRRVASFSFEAQAEAETARNAMQSINRQGEADHTAHPLIGAGLICPR